MSFLCLALHTPPSSAAPSRKILKDYKNRISKDFKIPKSLKWRTQFWFDIYSKYSKYDHVVHHTKYPWIIYEVINTDRFFKTKLNYYTQHYRAQKHIKKRKKIIKATLNKLAKRTHYKRLNSLEKRIFKRLKFVGGKRSLVFKTASRTMRTQLGQRDFIVKGLKSSNRYLPFMETEFKNRNLPKELTRIPFVESSFNVNAESKVGASGIWQIMPRTGRESLRVGKIIDERNSPYKSTGLAATQLKRNYKILGSWPLAVTAYNHGVGGMRKAVRKTRSNKIEKIITKYRTRSFRFASRNFYTSFLAALHVEMYRDEIFNDQPNTSLAVQKLRLSKRIRAHEILKKYKVKIDTFLSYNLDLKRALKKNILMPKGLVIYLPKNIN